MKLAQFIKSRNPDHRKVILRNISDLDFNISEVITLAHSSDLFAKIDSAIIDHISIPKTQLARVKLICNLWCRDNCSGKYIMPSKSITWAFEHDTDAAMFKLTWV